MPRLPARRLLHHAEDVAAAVALDGRAALLHQRERGEDPQAERDAPGPASVFDRALDLRGGDHPVDEDRDDEDVRAVGKTQILEHLAHG